MPKHHVFCSDIRGTFPVELGSSRCLTGGWEAFKGYSWYYDLAHYFKTMQQLNLVIVCNTTFATHPQIVFWQHDGVKLPAGYETYAKTSRLLSLEQLVPQAIAANEVVCFLSDNESVQAFPWHAAYRELCRLNKHVFNEDPLFEGVMSDKALFTFLGEISAATLLPCMMDDLSKADFTLLQQQAGEAAGVIKPPNQDIGQGVMLFQKINELEKLRNTAFPQQSSASSLPVLSSENTRIQANINFWTARLRSSTQLGAVENEIVPFLWQRYQKGDAVNQDNKVYDATTRIFFAGTADTSPNILAAWYKLPDTPFEIQKPGTSRMISAVIPTQVQTKEGARKIKKISAVMNSDKGNEVGRRVLSNLNALLDSALKNDFNMIFEQVLALPESKSVWFEYAWRAWTPRWALDNPKPERVSQVFERISTPFNKIRFGILMHGFQSSDLNQPLTHWASLLMRSNDSPQVLHLFKKCVDNFLTANPLPQVLWWNDGDYVTKLNQALIAFDELRALQCQRMMHILSPQRQTALGEICQALLVLLLLHGKNTEIINHLNTNQKRVQFAIRSLHQLPNDIKPICAAFFKENILIYQDFADFFTANGQYAAAIHYHLIVSQFLLAENLAALYADSVFDPTSCARENMRQIETCSKNMNVNPYSGNEMEADILQEAEETLNQLQAQYPPNSSNRFGSVFS